MSVYKQLTQDSERKCRPEILLRFLLSTSYPQTAITDLTFLFAKHGELVGEDLHENIALTMQQVERSFSMFDFVRSIEIKRIGKDLTIMVKCLDIDPGARNITDSIETHVAAATSSLTLVNDYKTLVDPEVIAAKLLEIFYKSQVTYRSRSQAIDRTRWKHRAKAVKLSKPVDTNIDYDTAIKYLTTSLVKKNFTIVLTQANILLQDQRSRIFSASRR